MTKHVERGQGLGISRLYVYRGKRVTTYYTITPGNQRINLGHDLKAAKRLLLEMDGEAAPPDTVAAHLDQLMTERRQLVSRGRLSADTIASNELEVVELKNAFGKMNPSSVRPKHVWDYLHRYRGVVAPVRANREIALFSRMFTRLMNQGVLDQNPCGSVERNEEVPRDRLVLDDEWRRLLQFAQNNGHLPVHSPFRDVSTAGKRVALAAELAYLTGKAQGQVIQLTRGQITDDGVCFDARKRGRRTLVEWTPALRSVVDQCLALPTRITSTYLIPNMDGQPYSSGGFKGMWQRLMNAWVAEGNEHFTFHDIRGKAVSDMRTDGRRASDLTGHTTEATIDRVYDRRAVRRSKAVR